MKTTIARFALTIALGAVLPTPAGAEGFRNVGYAGANFLQVTVDPVGAALGNSVVAHADGALGLYWNPGMITSVGGTEVLVSTVDWIIDTRVSFLGVVHSFDFGTVGVSATALTMDDMEITTEYEPDGTGSFFGSGSYAFGLTYAMQVIDRFSVGVTAKYVYEYIWETNGSTFAFDLGSIYETGFQNLRIGVRIANFGGRITFDGDPIDNKDEVVAGSGISFPNDPRLDRINEDYPLPGTFSVGIAIDPYRATDHRVTILASVIDPNDNSTQVNVGAEYAFRDMVFLRGGYKAAMDEQSWAAGIGLRADIGGVATQFDYAYSTFGILGQVNTLSLRAGF